MTTVVGTPPGVTASGFKAGPMPPLTGLAAWYDAANSSSFTYTSGSNVDTWSARSGYGPRLNAPGGANPVRNGEQNGKTTVTFTGSQRVFTYNQYMPTMVNDNFAIFVAAHRTNMAAIAVIPFAVGNGQRIGLGLSTNGNSLGFLRGGIAWHTSSTPDTSAPNVYTLRRNAGLWKFHRNGVEVVLAGAPVTAAPTMPDNYLEMPSASHPFEGEIFEVLFYQIALDDTGRQQAESYLKEKWGTT